jgi:tRNA nucleotidyltransferase (CCA-adding enzyme)
LASLPEQLQHASVPEAVVAVISRLQQRGHQAWLVGGCVRDLLRGVAPKDFDIATSAKPPQVQGAFPKVIPTGLQHGTVTVVTGGEHVEVTTFRAEGEYVDGRRPSSVSFDTDLEGDLSRRDFTLNAMAFDPVRGVLADPFDGQGDLSRGVLRCVGKALDRFSEDGLRALRAVRFAAVLGFQLEPETEAAIAPTLPVFRKVAGERVRDELGKLLLSPRPVLGLELLARTGLLAEISPELAATRPEGYARALRAVEVSPSRLELRLTALLHPLPEAQRAPVLERLKLSRGEQELIERLLRHLPIDGEAGWSDADCRRLVARLGEAQWIPLIEVAAAIRSAHGGLDLAPFRARVDALLALKPPLTSRALALNGGAIMKVLGTGPSPKVGEATRFLLDRVLEDPTLNSEVGLSELLKTWSAR